MNDGASERPDLRVSDAERDAAMAELGDHFQAGRLDSEEFSERLEAAASARTRGDLDRLMTDLPRPAPPEPAAPQRPPAQVPVGTVLAVILALGVAVAAATSAFTSMQGHMHGHWGWGAGWWVIVIPILLLRRLLWHGGHRGHH
jgi:DUF1707 SHOCT-like domain